MALPPEKMTKAELIAEVHRLQVLTEETADLQRVVEDLRVHQEEISVQNQRLIEMQAELERSRDLYADLYDSAPIGYATFDRNGLILQINLTGSMLIGKERRQIEGTPFISYVNPVDRQVFLNHLLTAKRGGGKAEGCEVRIDSPHGQVLLQVSSCPAGNEKGHLRVVLNDITAIRRAERERQELADRERATVARSQAKDYFLAVLSHVLRIPITPVLAVLEHLEAQAARDFPTFLPDLQMIRRNVEMEARLIDDLLDMTAITRGK